MAKLHRGRILQLASLAILAFGLGAAACVYLLVDDADPDLGGQTVIVNGTSYSVPAHATKLYVRDLQRFGGKAALLFDDLGRWFSGLWQGRALAGTILGISVIASLALSFVARILFPDEPGKPDG